MAIYKIFFVALIFNEKSIKLIEGKCVSPSPISIGAKLCNYLVAKILFQPKNMDIVFLKTYSYNVKPYNMFLSHELNVS